MEIVECMEMEMVKCAEMEMAECAGRINILKAQKSDKVQII